jgi:hypothetical protein
MDEGYRTEFVPTAGYAWSTNDHDLPAVVFTNSPAIGPEPRDRYRLALGRTDHATMVTSVYVNTNTWYAGDRGVSYETMLINTLAHEWYHQWIPGDEIRAGEIGAAAQTAYLAAGGDSGAKCNGREPNPQGGRR